MKGTCTNRLFCGWEQLFYVVRSTFVNNFNYIFFCAQLKKIGVY